MLPHPAMLFDLDPSVRPYWRAMLALAVSASIGICLVFAGILIMLF